MQSQQLVSRFVLMKRTIFKTREFRKTVDYLASGKKRNYVRNQKQYLLFPKSSNVILYEISTNFALGFGFVSRVHFFSTDCIFIYFISQCLWICQIEILLNFFLIPFDMVSFLFCCIEHQSCRVRGHRCVVMQVITQILAMARFAIQLCVIKSVIDLWEIDGLRQVFWFHQPITLSTIMQLDLC